MTAHALRLLADDPRSERERLAWIADAIAALRTAADQLDAVHDVNRIAAAIYEVRDDTDMGTWDELGSSDRERYECDARAAIAAITGGFRTAETAPQEDRDE